jgi:hypothetical protein
MYSGYSYLQSRESQEQIIPFPSDASASSTASHGCSCFQAATDPVRRAIYKKVTPSRFISLEEGLQRVRKGLFAFHVELGSGYLVISDTFLEEEKCGLQTMNFLIEIVEPWVGVSNTTPFKEILSIA